MSTVWTNAHFADPQRDTLIEGCQPHRLIFSRALSASNLAKAPADPGLADAEVAFGQPDPDFALDCPQLRWIHLNTAGYARYDGAPFRAAWKARGAVLTNSSQVYAEPCAEHVLSFIMAQVRELPRSLDVQRGDRSWPSLECRARCELLAGQRVVLLGFGAIGRRLAELLAPFKVQLTALRRQPAGTESVTVIAEDRLLEALSAADHVVNLLPENAGTRRFVDAVKFAAFKKGAAFYNIGRGTTVDQDALLSALQTGQVAAAYLDVTDPEPLPPAHPLWTTPNCYITPHSAGGHRTEPDRLVQHFLTNLRHFECGEPLQDRVI